LSTEGHGAKIKKNQDLIKFWEVPISSQTNKTILVTGAAGFIGSAYVRLAVKKGYKVVVLDSLTYAGHRENLESVLNSQACELIQGDIREFDLVDKLFAKFQFDGLLNFAAESHVDNSISGPRAFIETNLIGTFHLLEATRKNWSGYAKEKRDGFRFLHVSTDEVFGFQLNTD
jgi:dTDP-glucose 4,6-dehydratase